MTAQVCNAQWKGNVPAWGSGKDGLEMKPSLSTWLPCRVPWRLAAYLKDVGRATAAAEGILDVMKAQQKFFESVLQSGNKVSNSTTGGLPRQVQTSQASNCMHMLNRLWLWLQNFLLAAEHTEPPFSALTRKCGAASSSQDMEYSVLEEPECRESVPTMV